ncbi:hypothetical protein H920_11531 [Fukomys damarensis]|uniref:Uncharacterized protein n=1 Tax=Fukomys damarensis TaxID=885580 RepID=A0A091DA47_FUKDA|nr:hypothetical protein H920_11531 [Fukomys damarensis]
MWPLGRGLRKTSCRLLSAPLRDCDRRADPTCGPDIHEEPPSPMSCEPPLERARPWAVPGDEEPGSSRALLSPRWGHYTDGCLVSQCFRVRSLRQKAKLLFATWAVTPALPYAGPHAKKAPCDSKGPSEDCASFSENRLSIYVLSWLSEMLDSCNRDRFTSICPGDPKDLIPGDIVAGLAKFTP